MKYLLFLALFGSNWVSYAGVINGGGDKGVVCRNADGTIASAQTLDLFEAESLYGLKPRKFSGTIETVLSDLKADLQSTMDQPEIHLFPLIDRVHKIIRFVPSGISLKPVEDAAELAISKGCFLEQLANYVDDDLLLVSQEIWDHLSLEDRVALYLHEAIYRLERVEGAKDSRRTRKIVGHIISGFPFVHVKADLPDSAKICHAIQGDRIIYRFAYFPTGDQQMTRLQFLVFEGRSVFSKKTSVLPIKLPWIAQLNNYDCTYSDDCNIAGGDVQSGFENSGHMTLGIEKKVTSDQVQMKFYFLDSTGKSYLECNPK